MRLHLLPALLLILTITSCLQKDPIGSRPESPAARLDLSFSERLPERSLSVHARTRHHYGCSNFVLESSVIELRDRVRVEFGDVIAPEVCLTAPWPATTREDLGPRLAGEYAFQLRGTSGSGDLLLDVSPGAYRFIGRAPASIALETAELRRIPAGTIWGYIGYASTSLAGDVAATLGRIEARGAGPVKLHAGLYRVSSAGGGDRFRVDPSGRIVRDGAHGYHHLRSFAFHFTGDIEVIRQIVAEVGREHGGQIHLVLHTVQGEAMRSWVLGRV